MINSTKQHLFVLQLICSLLLIYAVFDCFLQISTYLDEGSNDISFTASPNGIFRLGIRLVKPRTIQEVINPHIPVISYMMKRFLLYFYSSFSTINRKKILNSVIHVEVEELGRERTHQEQSMSFHFTFMSRNEP